ncbi:MAG TPA: GNAT family N-acetyltransferase [Candidatus Limnocylindria bacterium]|nr:GNAT family N-acetyltransferase [Candidatus Limnocylindria bacterium]
MGGAAVTRIRLAETGDAEAIAAIQIRAWRAAYAEFLPTAFLEGLDVEQRATQWRGRIGPAMRPGSPTFVALDETDTVRGFAHTGPVRDEDLDPAGRAEIYTIYVDPGSWRRGIGSALLAAIDEHWAGTDVGELVLWAFEANADGRAFYERMGWQLDGARQVDDFGTAHPVEVRYRRRLTR